MDLRVCDGDKIPGRLRSLDIVAVRPGTYKAGAKIEERGGLCNGAVAMGAVTALFSSFGVAYSLNRMADRATSKAEG